MSRSIARRAPSDPTCAKRFLGLFTIILSAAVALIAATSGSLAAESTKRPHVLELFTSQGCSSCPPADALLGKLDERENIIGLTMPIDYWDHLGWKDTLAKNRFTKRQYAYAAERGDRQIYTPQIIVNGIAHVIGSDRDAVETAMRQTGEKLESAAVRVSLEYKDGAIRLEAGDASANSSYTSGRLWVACYSKSVSVDIARGENTGREITYTNVVRELLPAGAWKGERVVQTIGIPRNVPFDGIAAFLQADDSRAMLGAASIPFHSH